MTHEGPYASLAQLFMQSRGERPRLVIEIPHSTGQ